MKYSAFTKRAFWEAAHRTLADKKSPGDAVHWARNVINILKGQM